MIRKRIGARRFTLTIISVLGTLGLSVVLLAMAKPPQNPGDVSDVDPHKAFGSKTAPLVLEVFSDFQCPACKTLYATTNRQLIDNYVSNGKVFLIHRDFPLPMHAHSRVAKLAYGLLLALSVEIVPLAVSAPEEGLIAKTEIFPSPALVTYR